MSYDHLYTQNSNNINCYNNFLKSSVDRTWRFAAVARVSTNLLSKMTLSLYTYLLVPIVESITEDAIPTANDGKILIDVVLSYRSLFFMIFLVWTELVQLVSLAVVLVELELEFFQESFEFSEALVAKVTIIVITSICLIYLLSQNILKWFKSNE